MAEENEREYRRRVDQRRQDQHDEDRRSDRTRADRDRQEEVGQAWRDLRKGSTAWALRGIAGPDAAIDYLRATDGARAADPPAAAPEATDWPPHRLADTLAKLVENVERAPAGTRFELRPADDAGDVPVRAAAGAVPGGALGDLWTSLRGGVPYERPLGTFWLRAALVADHARAGAALERARGLLRDAAS